MRAHRGTRVPEGTGLGNLQAICPSSVPMHRFSAANGTHDEGDRVVVQLDEYSDQLMTVYVSSHEALRREQRWESYLVHTAPWHASHALMSEYATVLHLHRLVPSTPLGPVYEYPGFRALIVNAAKETSQQELNTQDRH